MLEEPTALTRSARDLLDLTGRVAIVTGAATGLGAATATMLAQAGAKVLVNHLEGQEQEALAVVESFGNRALCCAGDVSDAADCERIVATAVERFGAVDILVNNAGINKFVEHDDLDGLNAADFLEVYSVNVVGAYLMIRAAAPEMRKRPGSAVVNVSSSGGLSGHGSSVAYAASKGALNTMTKSLGRALAPHIRVNAVCPAFMNTPIWDKRVARLPEQQWAELRNAFKRATPLQIEGDAEIVSRTILFLASDLSAHMTGQLMVSDGGALLGVYRSMFETA